MVHAASVPCDLGGGSHGHLRLALTPVEYTNINPLAYIRHLHPGILNILVGTANYEATMLTCEHKERTRLNREANNVDTCLLKQVKIYYQICT